MANNGAKCTVDAWLLPHLQELTWTPTRQYFQTRSKRTGKRVLLHQLVNMTPPGFETDHRDLDKSNNCASNLRTATPTQNRWNRDKYCGSKRNWTSSFKGVSKTQGGLWRASLKIQDQRLELGKFNCELDAARAYNTAATKHFGEFARLNQI